MLEKRNEHKEFVKKNILRMQNDETFYAKNQEYLEYLLKFYYQYNFTWLGRPIIQIPQDIYAVQEMVWATKPDLIIETGIAHGGSMVCAASFLAQLDLMDSLTGPKIDGQIILKKKRHVLGIDIEIRDHNRIALDEHPLKSYWSTIEGSSVDPDIIAKASDTASEYGRVMVLLDSNHTHSHVLSELYAYGPLVSRGCYLVVWDSGLEDASDAADQTIRSERPWGKGNNPKTALIEYLDLVDPDREIYQIDRSLRTKIGISATSDSFLLKLKD
ncbi:MAG: CmcI family methyltransferase [Rhodospirillaceae bacterium]